jgi:hypothetical protein
MMLLAGLFSVFQAPADPLEDLMLRLRQPFRWFLAHLFHRISR